MAFTEFISFEKREARKVQNTIHIQGVLSLGDCFS